ncbi:MAG: hypothetical protein AB7F35_22685, partial [Acetobacteraceae bacterium]
MRFLFGFLVVVLPLLSGTAASAQPAATAPTAPTAPASESADVDTLVRILQNDKARAALIERLKGTAPSVPSPDEPSPISGLAGRVAEYTRGVAEQAMAAIEDVGGIIASVALVFRGAATIDLSAVWGAVLEVVAVIAVTFAVNLLFRWIGARVGQDCDRRAINAGPVRRMILLLLAESVDALGVVIAWGAGYAFALSVGGFGFSPSGRISFGQTLFLNAFLAVELIKVTLRLLTVPVRTHLRMVPLDDTAAAYWYFWTSRLVSLLGYSFLFAAPLMLYSGSEPGSQLIRIVAMFTATAIIVAIILQNRDQVRTLLATRLNGGHADTLGRIGAYLGSVWHLLAIAYVVTVLLVWLTNPGAALAFMMQATLQSVIAAGIGMAVMALISRLISTGMHLPQDVRDRLPLLESRLNAFVPAVLRVVRLVVLICVLVTVAQIWGLLNLLGWLATSTGRQVTGAAISVALILLIGGLVHLAVASWVDYRVNPNYGSIPTVRERT